MRVNYPVYVGKLVTSDEFEGVGVVVQSWVEGPTPEETKVFALVDTRGGKKEIEAPKLFLYTPPLDRLIQEPAAAPAVKDEPKTSIQAGADQARRRRR